MTNDLWAIRGNRIKSQRVWLHFKSWYQIVQIICWQARRKKPYTVVPLPNEDIIPFRDMLVKVQINLDQVKWETVKWIRYRRENCASIDNCHAKVKLQWLIQCHRWQEDTTKGPRWCLPRTHPVIQWQVAYTQGQKNDLFTLCKDGTI